MTPMEVPASDATFAGSIPELYERYLVPMIFAFYADDLAARVAALASGGFTAPARIDTLQACSLAGSALDAAVAYCQGTPLRSEIEARRPAGLGDATAAVAAALAERFGDGAISGRIQAHVITVAS